MIRFLKATLVLSSLLPLLPAQETRREITTAVSPRDSQPNSDKVPGAYAIPTQFERVVILRFKYNVDLLAELERMVKEQKIQNGVILNGWGSVTGYQIHQVSNRTFPSKNTFVKDPTRPADIAGMSGFVLNGRLHPHITLSTPDKAFGGHLEPGTTVFTFAVVTIGVLPDNLDLTKLDDKNYR